LVNGAGGNAKSATTEIEQISDMVDAPKSFYGLEIDGFNSVFNLNFIGTLLPTQILSQDMSHKKIRRCYQHFIDGGVSSAVENSCLFCSKSGCIKHHGMAGCTFGTNGHSGQRHGARILFNRAIKVFSLRRSRQLNTKLRACYWKTAMKRLGDPEELQGTLLYLASDISSFVTGVVIPVDGGFNADSGI